MKIRTAKFCNIILSITLAKKNLALKREEKKCAQYYVVYNKFDYICIVTARKQKLVIHLIEPFAQ